MEKPPQDSTPISPEELYVLSEKKENPEKSPLVENNPPIIKGQDAVVVEEARLAERLKGVREELDISPSKEGVEKAAPSFQAVLKPEAEWKMRTEIATEEPLQRMQAWLRSLSQEGRRKSAEHHKIRKEFESDTKKYPLSSFDYVPGVGIEGRVGKGVGILGRDFSECSGLVFQTPEAVSVLHISPSTIREPSAGGEIVREADVEGHIKSALRSLLRASRVEKIKSKEELSAEEIKQLETLYGEGKLKATLLAGEEKYVPALVETLARGRELGLPAVKTDAHYVGNLVGGGGYALYASPEDVYVIGSNNQVMKKGVNFPPTMFDYKDK